MRLLVVLALAMLATCQVPLDGTTLAPANAAPSGVPLGFEVTLYDHFLTLPTWVFGVIVGVLVSWLRWRSPWRKRS